MSYLILVIAPMLVGFLIQMRLKSKFAHYSEIPNGLGLSGAQVAQKMLNDNGIFDVKVMSVPGQLTDHYNPMDRTVNLSPEVYSGSSVAAAAVAAHECGHAVQHATQYNMLMLRSRLVPIVQFSSSMLQWVLLAGILLVKSFPYLLLVGIILFAATTIFSLITLPVEYDASNRALKWLEDKTMLRTEQLDGAKDALKWAARTYLVAAIASIGTLIYYINIFNSGRSRE